MNRQEFLSQFNKNVQVALSPSPYGKGRGGTPTTGLTAYSGTWTKKQAYHLLRRTTFGFNKSDLDTLVTKGMNTSVNDLLNITNFTPNPPINAYNTVTLIDPDVAPGATWVNSNISPNFSFQRRLSFAAWTMGQLLNQDINIREKMTLFWHNHFATEGETIQIEQYVYNHHALLRKNCIGNFKTLVKDITVDTGMLRYLNGYLNTKNAPDENYGRELQELFTLGKGVDSKYTESDVKAAARILTGWRINNVSRTSFFDKNVHDTSDKQFSSFYNNKIITGKTNAAGADETTELIDMIFMQEEVSKHLCRKLYKYFIYYEIDSTIESNVIVPLAKIFRDNNYEIKPVLETLFKSEHFYDSLNMACQIKNPLDVVIGFARQFKLIFPSSVDYTMQYAHWSYIFYSTAAMQMAYGEPPNVAGWSAYYQDPQFYEIWINTDTLSKRVGLPIVLIQSGYNRSGYKLIADVVTFVKQFSNPSNPNTLIDDMCEFLMPIDVSTNVKATLKSALLSGQAQDYYWTDAWNAYMANPNDTINKNYVINALKTSIMYILNLAEYQLN